jgi:hypothetical protein
MFNLSPNFIRYLGGEVKVVGLWVLFIQVNDLVERVGKNVDCITVIFYCYIALLF